MEPATAKGPPGFFGLVPQGKVPTDADIDRMARGEVGTVRLVANWALVEPTDDAWNFVALDAYIDDLAASGIRPFPVLFNTTPFVNSDGLRLPVHSGQDKEQWREFVAMVVQRYGAGGEYWKQQA